MPILGYSPPRTSACARRSRQSPTTSPKTASCCDTERGGAERGRPQRRGGHVRDLLVLGYGSCLAKAGEVERAEKLFDKLVDYANDLGLLAEEIDTADDALLGNFPRAFSHIGLITRRVGDRQGARGRAGRSGGSEMSTDYDVMSSAAGPPASTARGAWPPPGREGRDRRARAPGRRVSFWACIPSKTLLRPGEALARPARPRAPARRCTAGWTESAFAWRDLKPRVKTSRP